MFKGWIWIVLAVGVVWYLSEREKASIKIAGNRAATGAVDSAGRAVTGIINETGPAIGKWLSGFFSSSGSSTTSSSSAGSSGSGNASSPSTSSYAFTADEVATAASGESSYGDDFYT